MARQSLFHRFCADIRGAVAPLASLFIMVLAPLSGMAVDFIYAESAKRALQEAVDSALLAVAKANPKTQGEIDRLAARFLEANLDDRYAFKNVTIRVTRVEDGAYRGGAAGDIDLFFSGLFGKRGMTANVDGSVRVSLNDLEVVLALDTTGSMMGQKLASLKTAANGFVTTVMKGDNVRVGVVPFARYVNIGLGNRNEPGFDIPADTRACRREMVWENYNCRNCQRIPRSGTCYNDGAPYTCTWTETRCDCDRRQVERDVCNTQTWNGCVGSRPEPFNTRDDNPSVKIPGLLNKSCGAALTRLSRSEATLRASINGLVATGETYIPSGLSMGWATLSHRIPFADGSDPAAAGNRNLLRAIVLMTDGANTASKRSGRADHEGANAGDANRVTRELCENIKRDDVIVFTVAFAVNDASIKTLLRTCATAPAYAFDAGNAAELNRAFDDIATALSRLRLTE
jgi:Flp pilus assembly protein TadG